MKYPILSCGLLLAVASCAGAAITPQQQDLLAQAQRLIAEDPDAALTITDDLLATSPQWRPARILAAEGSLKLARMGRSNSRELFDDAARNYQRALDEDEADPAAWLGLAEAQYQLTEFEASKAAALQAATRFEAQSDNGQWSQAVLQAARSQLELFVALRREELADGEPDQRGFVRPESSTTAAAQETLGLLRSVQRQLPGDAYPMAAVVYQWLSQDDDARLELERGIRNAPGTTAVHLAYQDFLANLGDLRALTGAYSRFAREQSGQPMIAWFQGRAQVMLADDLRNKGSFQPAIDAYRKAESIYAEYKAMMPAHAATADEWRAICEIAIARTAVDLGDLEAAKTHLFAAAAVSSKTVAYQGLTPSMVDSFGAHYAGVVFAISRALSESGTESLRRTLAFNEEVIRRHPGMWGFVYNNAALPARDLGVAIAARANAEGTDEAARKAGLTEAMALWEKSYRYYQEAVRLSPEDPRIVNDCGLMLVYHLHRDFDRAREMFDRAIEVGQAKLDALPADAPKEDRDFLEEAVGDAWQNIAVMMARHQNRPWEEIKPFCEKAVTYYPYQRREAAAMLRNDGRRAEPQAGQGRPGAAAALFQDPQGDARTNAFAKARKTAEQRVEAGDLDGALATLDAVAKDLKDFAPFCALRGDLTLRYAVMRRAAGQTSGLELLFADAVANLVKAVELDSEPAAPRLLLAKAQYENGDAAAAASTASSLLLHLQSQGGGSEALTDATHLVRAQAAARAYVAAKGDDRDEPALLQDLRTSFRHLEKRDQLARELRALWSTTEQWAAAPAEAVNVWVRALAQSPDDQNLVATLVDTAVGTGQAGLAVDALEDRRDAFSRWYVGKARFSVAHELYSTGMRQEALAVLDQASKDFQASMAENAAFADSCQQWIAMCIGKKGCVAFAADRFEEAEQLLLEAARMRPDRVAENLGGTDSIKRGILLVADRHVGSDLGQVVRIYRAAAEAAYTDLDILNNLGLFARDHGSAVERAGKRDDARKLYEDSYAAYTKAQELDPTSVRLRNDRALMLVHHLGREWDLARRLLDEAIADGDRTLQENPPDTAQDRQDLEEAVGDCYENLALWHLRHSKDAAAAKAAAQKSMNYHPGSGRPGAQRHLRSAEALDKKGG